MALSTFFLPASASTPATSNSAAATINAAAQSGSGMFSANTAAATRAAPP
ncbi:Uncharacterised protein [Mycobacteroides abscessus subsp. abscessus]|nr:Uncharacterised protein [Mycobacteroides abscessus subsp. abscessus]